MPVPPSPTLLLAIDVLDEDTGLADIEDDRGRTFQLPAEWLPGAHDGAAYHAHVTGTSVTFTPAPDGARLLRERSKQTLLDFSDDHGTPEGSA
ncbi:hypothetical protein [Deinococcus sp.]|uniref:hypothetical protein n=1 Tax=Deinococcus sp. TaxID=47478 RepID=UPI002869E720|nr:hypothetical protein [Deinococcus sp.]